MLLMVQQVLALKKMPSRVLQAKATVVDFPSPRFTPQDGHAFDPHGAVV